MFWFLDPFPLVGKFTHPPLLSSSTMSAFWLTPSPLVRTSFMNGPQEALNTMTTVGAICASVRPTVRGRARPSLVLHHGRSHIVELTTTNRPTLSSSQALHHLGGSTNVSKNVVVMAWVKMISLQRIQKGRKGL